MPLNLQRFFRLSRIEQLLFIETFFLIAFFSLYLVFIPRRIIFKRLGVIGVESSFELIDKHLGDIRTVEKAVQRAVRFLPWKSKCFSQAIVAKRLLKKKKYSSTIYIGIAKEGVNLMIAHAWLRCGDIIVTGKEEMKKFTPVIYFT